MTVKLTPELNEIASAATDFNIFQGFLDQLANPDEVLRLECGGDISVYDNIGKDSRVGACLRTRSLAVIGKEWSVTPYSDSGEDEAIATYLKQAFLGFPFDQARRSLLRGGLLKGFSISEIIWDYSEGDVFIKDMIHRHQRRFSFNAAGQILLKTIEHPLGLNVSVRDGQPLCKFQHVTFGDEVDTPYGVGLARELYWPWWFKKNGIKFWVMFCDKFSGPTVVGEYEMGTSTEDQNKLLSAAQAVHSSNSLIYPKGMNLSLLESARSGNVGIYSELVEFMNTEMTICILGQAGTTQGTPGKLGSEQSQENVRADLVKADADALCEAMNSENGVVRWLVDYQFPGRKNRRGYPQIWITCEDETDELTVAERDAKRSEAVRNSGSRLTTAYFKRSYGLEDDEIEQDTSMPPSGRTGVSLAFAEQSTDTLFPDQSALDAAISMLPAAELQTLIDEPLKPVIELIQSGGDLDQVAEQLLATYPDMTTAGLEEALTRAFFVADLWGRLSANG